ncbi:DNA recombination protein RmuC [Agromyces mediolanus]|uniref:DNA recombination protein RmuC n=1 Tax=Agromyces mediolanus TaxID=41986 RepID=UPI001E52037D|nr:DNA recombination protein RmuC [Agromyces mediolanus]MCD1571949.1 DNA recombination protein RmuC [Agromyces mediolanus]
MEILLLIIGLLVGAALGGLATWVLASRRSAGSPDAAPAEDPALVAARHEAQLAALQAEHAAERSRLLADEQRAQAELRAELSAIEATAEGLREQILSARQQYREIVERHELERREREQREAADSKVLQALAPVKQTLTEMQSKVTALETQRHQQHGELSQQLKIAAENEERLRSTAESLASALRSNSTRGVWGETQLRSVVEAAGLIERVDFDTQHSVTTDAGAGRPDMVIHLPGGKHIAVDAKVPFNAYLEASQIPATATGADAGRRESLMKNHVKAVRDHITALGGKTYWEGLGASPEMVIAFIPSESLISSALEADPSLLEFAFSKRVALASPVTLWSVLKTVAFSWQQDVLTKEAKTLFDLSRELYGRLATTAGQIEKLGRTIERTVKDYNTFVGSLESRVLPTARKLKALDETKVLATLEGIEESPRELTAYEFTTAIPAERDAVEAAGDVAEAEVLESPAEPSGAADDELDVFADIDAGIRARLGDDD